MIKRCFSRLGYFMLVLTVLGVGICVFEPVDSTVEAARSKSRRTARSRRTSRRPYVRRTISKRRVPTRSRRSTPARSALPGRYPIAPDRIEVIEHKSTDHPTVRQLLDLPRPQALRNPEVPSESRRRVSTRIDTDRVTQIQDALQKRGLYPGEATGAYDENTIKAMREFQRSENIPVTGYPTAHALKRLGLAR